MITRAVDIFGNRVYRTKITVDQRGEKLNGIIILEVCRPVGEHGISRRMGLVEGVGRKIHHFIEDFVRNRLRHAVFHCTDNAFRAMDEVLAFLCHDVVLFLGHCASYQIAAPVGIACQCANDLHNLLLIDHAAIGGTENRLQQWVQIGYAAGIVLALDIARNLLHRAGAIEGDTCDEVFKTVRLELLQKLPHAAGFQLEHPVGIAGRNHLIHLGIGKGETVEIRCLFSVLLNKTKRIANDRERAKPKEVHLQQPEFFQRGHRKLRGDYRIVYLQRNHIRNRHTGDHNARRMRGTMPR